MVTRAFGLMGRRGLPPGGGLIIRPCSSVTTAFMRFHIDVVFVGRDNVVCHVMPAMVPWRVSKFVRGARFVVELPAGTAAASNTETGDTLAIVPMA
ncbi:MAG: DUF192 domain-containing protein [Chloroflexi bacterium]|nr:DUF192 domain-containing protein [Chloroflexota bacterium]